jgi:hypothetical protein
VGVFPDLVDQIKRQRVIPLHVAIERTPLLGAAFDFVVGRYMGSWQLK